MDENSVLSPGEEFQNQVFELVSLRLKRIWPGAILSISDNVKHGPIDVVATVKRKSDKLQLVNNSVNEIEERIYIECKDYTKKLSLDATGKAFCCALMDQPDYLIIASRFGLQPQALESAAALFNCDQITNVVFEDGQRTAGKPLTSIDFFHYTLDELSKEIAGKNYETVSTGTFIANTNFSFSGWSLTETFPVNRLIAKSDEKDRGCIWINDGHSYLFRVSMEFHGRKLESVDDLALKVLSQDKEIALEIKSLETDLESFLSLDFYIDHKSMRELFDSTAPCIEIVHPNGNTKVSFPLPKIRIFGEQPILRDINRGLEESLFQFILESQKNNIAFIEGEAGCGKTILGHRVSSRLSVERNYKLVTFNVLGGDASLLLANLVRRLSRIMVNDHSGFMDAFGEEATRHWINSLFPDSKQIELTGEEFSIEDLSSNALMALSSHILATLEHPAVIIFRDCHEASSESLTYIEQLLHSVSQDSSSQISFFIEWRHEPANRAELRKFKGAMSRISSINQKGFVVREITLSKLEKSLSYLFPDYSVKAIAASLYEKGGGNPLFIDQVIRHFRSKGYIDFVNYRSDDFIARIKDHGGIEKELSGFQGNITNFLEYRLDNLLSKSSGTENSDIHESARLFIWLVSLCPFNPTRSQILYILKISDQALDDIHSLLIDERILSSEALGEEPIFIHDLMRLAAKRLTEENRDNQFLDNLEDAFDKQDAKECLILGSAGLSSLKPHRAAIWFDRGQEAIRERSYYVFRLNLQGLDACLEKIGHKVFDQKIKHLDVKFDLGWAELQSGSKIDSRVVYETAKELAVWPFDRVSPEYRRIERHYVDRALHLMITVDVELLNLQEALTNINEVFSKLTDKNIFFGVSNRFLLTAMLLGKAKTVESIALHCFNLARACDNEGSMSVILSDLGSSQFSQNPDISLNLWRNGVEDAHEDRQLFHSKANILAADLSINKAVERESLRELIQSVESAGIDGQLSRLHLISGINYFVQGQTSEAEIQFFNALKYASQSDNTIALCVSIYNLIVIWVLENDFQRCAQYIASLDSQLSAFEEDRANVERLIDLAEQSFFSAFHRMEITESSVKLDFPRIEKTGPIWVLEDAVKNLKVIIGGSEPSTNPEYLGSGHFIPVRKNLGFIIF